MLTMVLMKRIKDYQGERQKYYEKLSTLLHLVKVGQEE